MILKQEHGWFSLVSMCCLTLTLCHGLAAQAPLASATEKLQTEARFKSIGVASEQESSELLALLESTNQVDWITQVSAHAQRHPQGAWTPAVRGLLAEKCKATARFSAAIEHFESVWAATKGENGVDAKTIADEALADYAQLLASLGRVDRLQQLFTETQGRTLASDVLNRKLAAAKEACAMMVTYPELAYRCGTFALRAVGKKLVPSKNLEALVDAHSPTNGFSLAQLSDMSAENGLELVAVRRVAVESLVVPSIVHWKENHYAAILAETNGHYLVQDPTFDMQKWMPGWVVNQEASGYFLIPRAAINQAWREVKQAEASQIRGRGYPNNIKDRFDEGCRKAPGMTECTSCEGSPAGMPVWWVSEPYLSLWLADEPLSYRTSGGEEVKFRLTYHQRDTRPATGSNNRVRPTTWHHNWFSFVELTDRFTYHAAASPFQKWNATLYVPSGGERDYFYASSGDPDDMNHEGSRTRLEPLAGTGSTILTGTGDTVAGFRLIHPDSSFDVYGFVLPAVDQSTGLYPKTQALLSLSIDRFGNTNRFYYETVPGASTRYRLKYFVDYDDRTNTLSYNASNLLSQVENPYGRTAEFAYDANNRLTNIFDAIQLRSAMKYDADGALTNLTTPYGVTAFQHSLAPTNDGQGNFGGHDRVARAVRVTEANGSKQLFLYRFDCTGFMVSTNTNGVPSGTPLGTIDTGEDGTNTFKSVAFRNSFHWGRKQHANLSTENFTNFTDGDFLQARMQHWLQNPEDLYVSQALSIERDPSPDGTTEGLKTFYDYTGKPFGCRLGTNSVAEVMARLRPNNQTEYTWTRLNKDGYPTNVVSTYSTASGTVGARTNVFVFGTNVTQYTRVTGVSTTAVWFSTNYNLLLRVLDASNQVVASFADYLTHTTKRVFYGYTPTAIVYTTSQQVFPTAVTNGAGEVTRYAYNARRRLASTLSPSGLTTTNFYNSGGFLTQIVHLEISRTNTFTYSDGQVATHTDARGLTRSFTWDGLRRLTRVDFPDSTYFSNRYDKLDLGAHRDRLGNWSYLGHNAVRQMTAFTNELGQPTQFSYGSCGCGQVESVTDALNQTTQFSYDRQLRPTTVDFPDGSQMARQYDLLGQLTRMEDGAGHALNFFYSHQGLRVAVSNAYGQAQRVVFDRLDRPLQVTDAAGVTVTNHFDLVGRLVARHYPDGGKEGFAYGTSGTEGGRLVRHTNQLGVLTSYAYDAAGRQTAITNANLEVTRFVYNASDLRELIDGKDQTNKWNYDTFGRVTSRVNASGQTNFIFTYDANDRMVSRWAPAKGTTWFTNDAAGNLTAIHYPSSAGAAFEYDGLNRVRQMHDAVGTTVFAFSPVGQLASEDGPWAGDLLTNIFAQQMRMSSALNTWATSYGYDDARRMHGLTNSAGGFGYAYLAASGLRNSISLPNGAGIQNTFDPLAQLTETKLVNSSATVLNSHTYGYNTLGQRTGATNLPATTTSARVTYSYDAAGQLLGVEARDHEGTYLYPEQISYGYDAAGNLRARTNFLLATTFTSDRENQLTNLVYDGRLIVSGVTTTNATNVTVNGLTATLNTNDGTYSAWVPVGNGTNALVAIGYERFGRRATNTVVVAPATLQYDANGNMTFDGTRGYGYDDENQLTAILETNQWKTEFVYDGLGRRRIRKEYAWASSSWNQMNETRYLFDGFLPVQERDGNNTVQVTYTRGLDLSGGMQDAGGIGSLLARTDANGSAYYHADGSGNITALINGSESLVANYAYDPYGNMLLASGTLASANEMRLSSMLRHWQSGVSLYHARAYAPNLQRFTQADPIGFAGGINLHAFVGNDPVNWVDPWGYEFRLAGGNGGLMTPGGPLGYLTGDSAAENLASGAYNVIPAVGNTAANAVDALLMMAGMTGEAAERLETSTVGKDGSLAMGPLGGGIKVGTVGLKMLGAFSRAKCLIPAAKETQSLFHYTNQKGLSGILESGNLRPSLKAVNPNDVRYGNGQYLSDIVPGTRTLPELSYDFLRNPFQGQKFSHYIEIDVSGLNTIQGRPGVFVVPNEVPLNLGGRIISHGPVP